MPPVLGRPSPSSTAEPRLGDAGEAAAAGWRADGATTGWCSLRAASVVGVRHRLAGRPSDDSYAWGVAGGVVVAAVADGIGSLAGSGSTAAGACRAAVRRPAAGEDGVRAAVAAANEATSGEGGGATTLVVAAITPSGTGWAARVGDSTAFVVDPATGRERELFAPPDPDRADGATAALPAAGLSPEVVEFAVPPGGVLALLSDGVADPWRDGPTTVAPSLSSGLLARPGPLELLRLADFSRRGCHDDRTIVAVWPISAEEPGGA